MFWDGPPLGFPERLCIKSFLDIGHKVVLFSYASVEGAPQGVEHASATDILPNPDNIIRHKRTGSASIHADKFRYSLLAQNDGIIWSDTDAYCLKPFVPKDGYFLGREKDKVVANGVLALPAGSPTLRGLIAFCEDEYAILPWMMPRHRQEMQKLAKSGDPMHVTEMPWGAWGPKALSHFLKKMTNFAMLWNRMYFTLYHSRTGAFIFAMLGRRGNLFKKIRYPYISMAAGCGNVFGISSTAYHQRAPF